MKGLIVYYSLTNSTSKIAEHIAKGLQTAGFEISLCNIKNEAIPDLKGFDLLGIGTPVYYFQIPIHVLAAVKGLSNQTGIKTFAFLTNGSYSWNAGDRLKKALRKQGFSVQGWFYCHGANYFYPYNKLGCMSSPYSPTAEDLALARKFGYDMATAPESAIWGEKTASPPWIYQLEQILTSRVMIRHIFQKWFYLNKKQCIQCGACIKGCPVHNLDRGRDGFPHWNRNCIMCLTCEANCPREAIRSPVSWLIMKPLVLYNVKQIMNDPDLERIKVSCHNGKIEIMK